eukprot:NODE_2565_length_674_cov_35.235200_g2105_i0.p1 GENE.NODE_2565_length_674_cov_35.235200_g2105_i0~~NODE_2565_length_674_cov_35.235200_g2105_i0.p1  ORF type:complete len:204 (-),score=45.45 NODE_2565_length_674_cov_35.235200_g2105_i0:63-617(-)
MARIHDLDLLLKEASTGPSKAMKHKDQLLQLVHNIFQILDSEQDGHIHRSHCISAMHGLVRAGGYEAVDEAECGDWVDAFTPVSEQLTLPHFTDLMLTFTYSRAAIQAERLSSAALSPYTLGRVWVQRDCLGSLHHITLHPTEDSYSVAESGEGDAPPLTSGVTSPSYHVVGDARVKRMAGLCR